MSLYCSSSLIKLMTKEADRNRSNKLTGLLKAKAADSHDSSGIFDSKSAQSIPIYQDLAKNRN